MALRRIDPRLAGPVVPVDALGEGGIRSRRRGTARGFRTRGGSPMVQCGIAMRRVGPRGWLKVTGELTTMTSRHLDDYLGWLITEGVRQITVSLATAHEIDQPSLRVLSEAQSALRKHGGELFVTAARATTRRKLNSLLRPSESQRVRAG